MKLSNNVLWGIVSLLSFGATAAPQIDYNVGFTSHYVWRGFDLNDASPALQGGVDATYENGIYSGIWGSQYDFGGFDDGIEIDFYVGYEMAINSTLSIDMSVNRYSYTGDSDNTTEWKIGLVHELFALNYYYDQDLSSRYYEVTTSWEISSQLNGTIHAGLTDVEDETFYDYGAILSYQLGKNWAVDLGYSTHEFDEEFAEPTLRIAMVGYF